jgi:hypothetical protein
MLAVAVFEETEPTTVCEGGCGTTVETDEDNFFSVSQNACQHFSGDSGYYCDLCWPYCPCTEGN